MSAEANDMAEKVKAEVCSSLVQVIHSWFMVLYRQLCAAVSYLFVWLTCFLRVPPKCEKIFAPTEFVECIDESGGCGAKLRLTVVSNNFDKVPLIQRHRRVHKALAEAGFGMDQIHALTIKAWTVEQYQKKMAK